MTIVNTPPQAKAYISYASNLLQIYNQSEGSSRDLVKILAS